MLPSALRNEEPAQEHKTITPSHQITPRGYGDMVKRHSRLS